MTRFLVGFGLALATIMGALAIEGGNGLTLLGLSAFLNVWFVPFFASAAIWGYRHWVQAWGAAFHRVDPVVARRSASLWRFNEFAFYLVGVLAALMGDILILGQADFPAPFWNHQFAADLIAPLYGFFFGYMARILRARVESLNS
jgi:flagellar motor component MotA